MRKTIIIICSVLLVVFVALISLFRSSSDYKSIYFVPEDAVIIIEIKDPVKAWNSIVQSNTWKYLKTNKYFNELNTDIESFDSLVNSSKFLFKLIGEKPITISSHYLGNNKYEQIYIIDAGKVANSNNPEKVLKTFLGKDYELTTREYNQGKIVEIFDLAERENYFITFNEGHIVFSFEPSLVEKALDASVNKVIGRNMGFLKVQSKISHNGLINFYLKNTNLSPVTKALQKETELTFKQKIRFMDYCGLYLNVDHNDILTLEGYINLNDSTPDNYLSMLKDGSSEVISSKVIPKRLASLSKIHFTNANRYVSDAMRSLGNDEYESYKETLYGIEKKLKFNFNENLFSWMDEEIVFLQTQPSNLGRDNEFALLLHAKDSAKAANNLAFIWKQIKKNSPVKIKSVNYKNYKIDYVAFPGILQALFGKTIEKLEKPYFTQIGQHVLISNHPQTLKNIIDDYLNETTLNNSKPFFQFNELFTERSSVLFYAEPPVLFENLKAFVDATTWYKLKQNKNYYTCFSQIGSQLNKKENMLHFNIKAKFEPQKKEYKLQYYNPNEIVTLFDELEKHNEKKDSLPHIIISNLDSKKHVEHYKDGTVKLEVKLKDGQKHGTLKLYHENGELSIKGEYTNDQPTGKWKYYDENGELIKTDVYE